MRVILGSRTWPWPEQVAANSSLLPGRLLFLFLERLRATRQSRGKQKAQAAREIAFGP